MWSFGIGVMVGIYLGTYYDFHPFLKALEKWGLDRLPRKRRETPPARAGLAPYFFPVRQNP